MVCIGTAVQSRILQAATRCFGPGGESLVHSVTQQTFDLPLEQLTYADLPALFEAVDRAARLRPDNTPASALAAAFIQLQADVDAGMSGRLVGILTSRVGSAAERLLNGACATCNVPLDTIDPSHLPELADAIRAMTSGLLGAETAEMLHQSVLGAASARPAGLTRQIQMLAREHLGEDGEAAIDRLCREHLEIALDELDAGSVRALALAVERYGPSVAVATQATEFVAEARAAIAGPAAPLRGTIVQLTQAVVGPLAREFLDEVCGEHGMPFEAIEHEHLIWLAEVLRAEAEPLAGKEAADDLARGLRAILAGQR